MKDTALLVIDAQKGFDDPVWGVRNNPEAESNIELLLASWRRNERPVIHIQHCSLDLDSPLRSGHPGNAFKDGMIPVEGEALFTKTVNSAFIGTGLEEHLQSRGITSLIIVGLTTDHCISTSTRMAGNLGFEVTLISDATATFNRCDQNGVEYSADEIHHIHLASLNGEFCDVKSTQEVLSELC